MAYTTFAGSASPSLVDLDANFAKAAEVTSGTANLTVVGSATAGTATYSTRTLRWTRHGKLIHVAGTVEWTGHTGSGALLISGLPAAAGILPVLAIYARNLTFSGQLGAYVVGTDVHVVQFASGVTATNINIDAAATIGFCGTYEAA